MCCRISLNKHFGWNQSFPQKYSPPSPVTNQTKCALRLQTTEPTSVCYLPHANCFPMQQYNSRAMLCCFPWCLGQLEWAGTDQGQLDSLTLAQVTYVCFPSVPERSYFCLAASMWKCTVRILLMVRNGNSASVARAHARTHTLTQRYLNVLRNFMGIQQNLSPST